MLVVSKLPHGCGCLKLAISKSQLKAGTLVKLKSFREHDFRDERSFNVGCLQIFALFCCSRVRLHIGKPPTWDSYQVVSLLFHLCLSCRTKKG